MGKYNYILGPIDTDSVSFSKPDFSPFTEEEQQALIKEINSLMPEKIKYAHDGYFRTVVVLKAKNYILEKFDGSLKVKGSSLKDQKKEPVLKELINEVVQCLLNDRVGELVDVYHKYIKKAYLAEDISVWCTKKGITKAIMDCARNPDARSNEMKIYDTIKHKHFQEGDKVYLFPVLLGETIAPGGFSEKTGKPLKDKVTINTGWCLLEDFNSETNVDRYKLCKRVYDTMQIFENVLAGVELIDYSKKTRRNKLEELLGGKSTKSED